MASTVAARADSAISRNIFSRRRHASVTGYPQFADATVHRILEKEPLKGKVSGPI